MFRTFNMGIGMEVYVSSSEEAEKVIACAKKYAIPAFVIGHTEAREEGSNQVKIGDSVYSK